MAVLQEKQLFITFGIYRLTKNKQHKISLMRKLTWLKLFPKSSYVMGLHIYNYGFVKKKYHEKCKQDTFSMPKAIKQTRLNHWTKDERKDESQ